VHTVRKKEKAKGIDESCNKKKKIRPDVPAPWSRGKRGGANSGLQLRKKGGEKETKVAPSPNELQKKGNNVVDSSREEETTDLSEKNGKGRKKGKEEAFALKKAKRWGQNAG